MYMYVIKNALEDTNQYLHFMVDIQQNPIIHSTCTLFNQMSKIFFSQMFQLLQKLFFAVLRVVLSLG